MKRLLIIYHSQGGSTERLAQALSRHMETEYIEQMEPIKFTPRHVCGGILHQKAIKKRRNWLRARRPGQDH